LSGTLFVDTGAWVGLFAERDQYHDRAVAAYDECVRTGRDLITTDYVLSETVVRVRQIAGLKVAAAVWDFLESQEVARMIEVAPPVRQEARSLFDKCAKLDLSLVDCVSFVVMSRVGIQEAFTFDADFKKAGFLMFPRPGNGGRS